MATATAELQTELINRVAKYRADPLGFVNFAYPWGEVGGPLEGRYGPLPWQSEALIEIGAAMQSGRPKIRIARASGKGIGKSALVSWIGQWALSTFADTRAVITAGTEPQLRTKTMPEFAKWSRMCITRDWFVPTATSLYSRDAGHDKTWRLDAIPWNENNPEAFAGLHNLGKRTLVIFDEASQIATPIWDTTDGIMGDADTEVIWAVFGNPTRGTGRFYDCFHQLKHLWKGKQIDSRSVPITDREELDGLVEAYGEDSDYVRVNVRGMFPRLSSIQFISTEHVMLARKREALCALSDPLIMGVDVARYGDDKSIIAFRKGRDARTIPWQEFAKTSTTTLADAVMTAAQQYHADAIHIDGGGVGGGVIDICRNAGFHVREVQFGARPDRIQLNVDATRYANKRSEMWGYMREGFAGGLAVPDDADLEEEITNVQYGLRDSSKGSEIILEAKEHMKRRGVGSPDKGDALALTYAYPVLSRGAAGGPHAVNRAANQALVEYDPFA